VRALDGAGGKEEGGEGEMGVGNWLERGEIDGRG